MRKRTKNSLPALRSSAARKAWGWRNAPLPARQIATLCLGILALAFLRDFPAAAQTGKQKSVPPHAVVAGTVFRDPGLAQAGAAVTLSLKDDAKGKKLQTAASDTRGEFAFRVPPGPATYVVRAALKGFRPTQQEIEITGEEQVNATLLLVPESK